MFQPHIEFFLILNFVLEALAIYNLSLKLLD